MSSRARRGPISALLCVAIFGLLSTWSAHARAYAWLLRESRAGCGACHVDPSGGSMLTDAGREAAEQRVRFASLRTDGAGASALLFGALGLPEGILLGGDTTLSSYSTKLKHRELASSLLFTRADLWAALSVGRWSAAGTLGYAEQSSLGAAVTRRSDKNLVSREHWLGYALDESPSTLLRAGRVPLPFGLRTPESRLWVRSLSRTTIDDDQQHGLTAAWQVGGARGELMAILGNFQLRPDVFRERGYAGFFELGPQPHLALGLSSLMTRAELSQATIKTSWRHVHGAFAKVALSPSFVLLTEADYVLTSTLGERWRSGLVGYLQTDYEVVQGAHLLATFEAHDVGIADTPWSGGFWLSYLWFFAPHADLRLDGSFRSEAGDARRLRTWALELKAHVFL